MNLQRAGLIRPWDDRLIGGVCVGIARRLGIDVTLVRIVFALLALAKGLGVLLYALLWILLPAPGTRERDVRRIARQNVHGFRREVGFSRRRIQHTFQHSWSQAGDRRWIAVGLVGGGAAILLWSFGAFSWLSPMRFFGLAVIVLGGGLLISVTRSGDR